MPSGVPILTFHALETGASPLAFPPGRFAELLAALARRGRRGQAVLELVQSLDGGSTAVPGAFGVTFDDGYRSVYDHALPALAAHAVPATVFVSLAETTAATRDRLPPMLGRERLSWTEMREMSRHGIEFGAHTLTHPDLTRLPASEVERQMRESQRRLEDALSLPVRSFAYPFGRYDRRCRDLAAGIFAAAFSDRLGLTRPGDDRYALPRVETYYLRSRAASATLTRGGVGLYLALRDIPRRLRRAVARR